MSMAEPQNVPPPDPNDGYIQVARCIHPSFANVTHARMAQNSAAKSHTKATAVAQNRTATRKHIPQPTLPKNDLNVMEVVVIRNGGFKDLAMEDALRQRHVGNIVQEVQSALERSTQTPLKILKGAWSTSSHYMGNFVYTLVGNLPLAHIMFYQKMALWPLQRRRASHHKGMDLGANLGGHPQGR